jgi:hypothetical protein
MGAMLSRLVCKRRMVSAHTAKACSPAATTSGGKENSSIYVPLPHAFAV